MLVTLNGSPVLQGTLVFPSRGNWHFTGKLGEGETVPATPSLLSGPGLSLSGSAYRAGIFRGTAAARLVGGAGGLAEAVRPRSYDGATLALLASDIASDAGEALSSTADPSIADRLVVKWNRIRLPAASALDLLCEDQGITWRVLDDGTIWVGLDTWPVSPLDGAAQVLSSDEASGRAMLGLETCTLRPGTTFGGRRVALVEYSFSPALVRAEVEYA